MSRAPIRLEPALDFLQHLWQLNHAMERTSARMEDELGVTAQQRLLIRVLGARSGMTAAELAAVLHLDPATISVSLKRLEARGLLKRRRDPADRRRSGLSLTPKGRSLTRASPLTVEAAVKRTLRHEGERNSKIVRRVLRGLAQALSAKLDDSR